MKIILMLYMKNIKLNENDLRNLFFQVKEKKIDGINVTVPFQKNCNPFFGSINK